MSEESLDGATVATADDLLVPPDSEVTPELSIVMPTMNEAEGVGECIERAKRALLTLGMTGEIIVSDSSTDRTPEIARENGAIVLTPDGKGYGYAYRYAFERARGDYIAIGDADTTYDFEELPKLLELVAGGDADIAMGSRLRGSIESGAMPALHRYVGNPLLTRFLNTFYDANVSDAHSGFRILSREALETLDLRSDGMEFASEMIMDASAKGLTIEERPITYHRRKGEATLESFRDGWRHVRFMLVNAPGYLFIVPAILFAVVGFGVLGAVALDVEVGDVAFGLHAAIAGCFVLVLAFQAGVMGVASAVATNPIRAPTDPVTRWVRDYFRLEHGIAAGLLCFTAGAAYTAAMFGAWVAGGFPPLPLRLSDVVAFTLAVLGAQTVFYSFFLSVLAK